MKVAIIGSGKTGSKVQELLRGQNPDIFNTTNKPSLQNLQNHDVIICFVPGNAFIGMLDMLIDTKLPVITGSTGFTWPDDLNKKLKDNGLKWIHADNFGLGMNLVYNIINVLKKTSNLFNDYNFTLHEVHHTKKKDIPSGTALMWQKWLEEKVDITSERSGDAIGTHALTLNTENEKITLTHESLDRKIFAQGAIWAANEILNNNDIGPGLHNFTELINKKIWS